MACQYCKLCEAGFPIQDGFHVPTQALGMIPATRCTAIPSVSREAKAMGFTPEAAALLGRFAKATKRRQTAERRWRHSTRN